MFYKFLFLILLLYSICQILLTGPVFRFLFRLFFSKYGELDFKGFGIFPFLHIYIWDLRFIFYGSPVLDKVYFYTQYAKFKISILDLFKFKFIIFDINLISPQLHYHNRSPEIEQLKTLPSQNKVLVKNLNITNGLVYILDERKWPLIKIVLNELNVENLNLDLSNPTLMFFQTKFARAGIGGGQLNINNPEYFAKNVNLVTTNKEWKHLEKGSIQLWGLNWQEFVNLKSLLPLKGIHLGLSAQFVLCVDKDNNQSLKARGILGSTNKEIANLDALADEDVSGFTFNLDVPVEKLSGTLSMGIQQLIENMVKNAAKRLLKVGILWSGIGLLKLIKNATK